MPKYTAQLTNGKTITLEGDEQPSDTDFEQAAKGVGGELLPEGKTLEAYRGSNVYLKQPFMVAAADTMKHIPSDLIEQAKGMAGLVALPARAAGETGSMIGNKVRETFGFQPGPDVGTEALQTIAGLPRAAVEHYKGYGDENTRAIQMREHPVGTAADVVGIVSGARGAAGMMKRIPRPSVGQVAQTALDLKTGGVTAAARRAVGGGLLDRLLNRAPGVVKATEKPLMTTEDVMGPEAAAERAWLMRRSGESTPSPAGTVAEPGSMGGPLANPRPLAVHDSQAIKDMMHPESKKFVGRAFEENNPIYRRMQGNGQFGQRGVDEATQDLVDRLRTRLSSTAAPEPMTVPSHAPEAPVSAPPRSRGLTKDAMERATKQATPGWQEVSLEPSGPPSSLVDLLKQRELSARPAPVKRPSAVEPVESMPASAGSEDATYYRLKVKPHLNSEEQAIFNKLEAKRVGTAYAARRKP